MSVPGVLESPLKWEGIHNLWRSVLQHNSICCICVAWWDPAVTHHVIIEISQVKKMLGNDIFESFRLFKFVIDRFVNSAAGENSDVVRPENQFVESNPGIPNPHKTCMKSNSGSWSALNPHSEPGWIWMRKTRGWYATLFKVKHDTRLTFCRLKSWLDVSLRNVSSFWGSRH